jgi:predicted SAM-dependent methyltransferase
MMRALKPEGVLRIAMPDLEITVDKYVNVPIEKDKTIQKFGMDWIKTRAERINVGFRYWGHKWLYDWEELERRVKEAGFENVLRCEWGKSKCKELCGMETREESVLIAEVRK